MMKKTSAPTFRRYSEPCLTARDEVDCARMQRPPPPSDLLAKDSSDGDDGCAAAAEEEEEEEEGEEGEEEEEWMSKLTTSNRTESWSQRIPLGDDLSFDGPNSTEIPVVCDEGDLDFRKRTMRTFRMGMRKIWRRGSATITEVDPTNKVVYLGNVLTGWAKGEGCIEKPLHALWKNYSGSTKPDVHMKITVTQSGLKAVTKDHGLTEYWSHRITYCSAPTYLPRVFCWVYRHEGRKLKQELRCHAVLCSKESTAKRMASTLRVRLTQALSEFKRDKLLRQKARLSLANSVYDNPSLPRRKILLSTGSQNYRPPLERSKSAPKLMPIEESLEEDGSSPRAKRKPNEEGADPGEGEGGQEEEEEAATKAPADARNADFKLANLNFVKKLCSSIENLVESTSNYGKKLLSERRSSRDSHVTLKKAEESILKESSCWAEAGGGGEEQEGEEDGGGGGAARRAKTHKSVKFEGDDAEAEAAAAAAAVVVVVEVKDHESDEGSNSLQSISSWSSDVSSQTTTSDAKTDEKDYLSEVEMFAGVTTAPGLDRLETYLKSCNDASSYLSKIAHDPNGEAEEEEEDDDDDGGRTEAPGTTFPAADREQSNDLSDDEEDVVSDESGYVELTDHVVNRLTLDRKEKDVPYHRIIKSNLLRPRGFETCLQV